MKGWNRDPRYSLSFAISDAFTNLNALSRKPSIYIFTISLIVRNLCRVLVCKVAPLDVVSFLDLYCLQPVLLQLLKWCSKLYLFSISNRNCLYPILRSLWMGRPIIWAFMLDMYVFSRAYEQFWCWGSFIVTVFVYVSLRLWFTFPFGRGKVNRNLPFRHDWMYWKAF